MARPHPYFVNNAFLGTWRPYAKSAPDWSLINFFKAKKLLPVGMAMTKLQPLPCPHMFNDAYLGSRRVYTEFRPFRSECLAVMPRHKHFQTKIYIKVCLLI